MKKRKPGRPPKTIKKVNPQVQFGRHPQEEIDLIDEAAKKSGKTRSRWAWDVLIPAAQKEIAKK